MHEKNKIALARPAATYANWYSQPSLGLVYLFERLHKAGYEVKIFDAYYHGWTDNELVDNILEYRPDIMGISAMTHEISRAADLAANIKSKLEIPTIIGGCHVTALPIETLEEFAAFDFGVISEGEKVIVDLVDNISKNTPDYASVKGVVWCNGSEIIQNERQAPLSGTDLEEIPINALKQYYTNGTDTLAGKDKYHVIFSSRGCPYSCAFCMHVLGQNVRYRSIESVIDEMKYAIEQYGAHTFDFADEVFLFNNERTKLLLQAIIDAGLPDKVRWSGLTRANLVTDELVSLAKQAGCFKLEMGVESGDDQILKNINKKITISQIRNAVSIIKKHNIQLGTYYILGHPGETKETVIKTVNLAIELNTNTIAVGVMVPYPGTKVYDMACNKEFGYELVSKDWSKYDKYGGKALLIKDLPYEFLEKWQKKALILLFLKNGRFIDMIGYLWKRRNAIAYFVCKKIFSK